MNQDQSNLFSARTDLDIGGSGGVGVCMDAYVVCDVRHLVKSDLTVFVE